jgi:hypothetical protein
MTFDSMSGGRDYQHGLRRGVAEPGEIRPQRFTARPGAARQSMRSQRAARPLRSADETGACSGKVGRELHSHQKSRLNITPTVRG